MPRIRSIKPSIWTDERFLGLSRDARLLTVGMISHADDHGRLLASAAKLAGDIFPTDSVKHSDVSRWRDEIHRSGLIRVYRVNDVPYAVFPRWAKHQRISKPRPPMFPDPPPEDDEARNGSTPERGTVPHPSAEQSGNGSTPEREPRARAVGSREYGSREYGSREYGSEPNGSSPRRGSHSAEPEPEANDPPSGTVVPIKPRVTAQDLIAEWLEHRTERPPERFIGQISKGVKQLLDEGIDPRRVRDGLAAWHRKNLGPSALPSVVAEVMNGGPNERRHRLPTADQRAVDGAALEARLRAEESS